MVGCEGASFSEDIFAGCSGYIPDSLNPLMRLTGVNACGQASPTSRLMSYMVMTFPGLLRRYFLHASLKWAFKDLKTPTSSGCNRWLVCKGKHTISM